MTDRDLYSDEAIEQAMRARLDAATEALNVKRREIREYEEAVRRISRALSALTGEPRQDAGKPGPKPKPKGKQWTPSPATVAKVQRVFEEDPGAKLSVSQVAEQAGVAHETARRALDHLREIETIRAAGAGKTRSGMTNLYALMSPNGAS